MKNKKILIIKHGAIGDIFMAFNCIEAIFNYHSNITICSTTSGFKALDMLEIKYNKIIDNRANLFTSFSVLKKIISKKFDLVIDLQNSKRTSIYIFFLRIFNSSILNGTSLFANKRYLKKNYDEHVIIGLENQLKIINILSKKKITTKYHPKLNQVVIIPGSSLKGIHKRWPLLKFIELINYFIKNKYTSYIIGGEDENDISPFIPINKYVVNLINKSPWEVVKNVSLNSKIVISNDTSAMHFIGNLNIPIIALMNDNIYSIRNSPNSVNSKVLKNKNIENISVEQVINEVKRYI